MSMTYRPAKEPTKSMGSDPAFFSCWDLEAYYGESYIVQKVSFDVREGEILALLGRNGAGRSTTLKAIMNMVGRRTGSIMINGEETMSCAPHHIARLGVGYCPEHRGIFSGLNVMENLTLPPVVRSGGMGLEEIFSMFPNLYERRTSPGTKLSGGEQQMLAMARILRTGANMLLLDEITEGLAPVIVETLGEVLVKLKEKGLTIVLVEQNFHFAAPLADRHYVMEHGQIVEEIGADELEAKQSMLDKYLGV